MSLQDTNPKNPINGGLDGLKQQALSTAENQIAGKISEKLDNPVVNKIVENKNAVKKVVEDISSFDEKYPNGRFAGTVPDPAEFQKFLNKKKGPLVGCAF